MRICKSRLEIKLHSRQKTSILNNFESPKHQHLNKNKTTNCNQNIEQINRAWMKRLTITNVITIYMMFQLPFAMVFVQLSRRHLSYLVSSLFSLSVSMPCSSICCFFFSFTEEVLFQATNNRCGIVKRKKNVMHGDK